MTAYWATITKDTFDSATDEKYCNETIVRMIGTNSLATDTENLTLLNGWASGTDTDL
jgi:hypothetical protein